MKTFIATIAALCATATAKNVSQTTNFSLNSAKRSDAFFTVRNITIPKVGNVSTFSDGIRWKDQGWGNQKGAARFQIVRKGKVVATQNVFGIAAHGWRNATYNANKAMKAKMQAGDTIRMQFRVGGGGGHRLHVANDRVRVIGAAPKATCSSGVLCFKGWHNQKNLKNCQGDCDSNRDCAKGLKCKQRNKRSQTVSGCKGNKSAKIPYNADFCYRPKPKAVCPKGVMCFKGWSNQKNLKNCQGDCDSNRDCAKGLKCKQRSKGEAVHGCKAVKKWTKHHDADFCYRPAPKVVAPAHSGADFATGLSFLAGPSAMANAERVRMQYIRESMKLSRDRAIKVRGYFNARNIAASALKYRKMWYAKAKAAGSAAKLAKSLHVKALAHELAMQKKRRGAFTKWEVARTEHTNAIKRRAAAQADFKRSDAEMARTAAELAKCKAELAASWKNENRRSAERAAARENYVKWAKAHRAAIKGRKLAGLKAARAAKASAVADMHHKKSVATHMAAINRRAAARAAAIKAHMAVQRHARNAWQFMAQEE